MRRSLGRWMGAIAIATAFASASAGEVVRFVDGRYLEVESHAVEGNTLKLVVKPGGEIRMPVSRVEQIRRDDEVVFTREAAPGTVTVAANPKPRD